MALLERFKGYIIKENLIEKGESILLGVSGGPDSLTMLDLFCRIKDECELELLVFHLKPYVPARGFCGSRICEEGS